MFVICNHCGYKVLYDIENPEVFNVDGKYYCESCLNYIMSRAKNRGGK